MTDTTSRLNMVIESNRNLLSIILLASLLLVVGQSFADNRTQAKRIHDRLTGVVPSADTLDEMVNFIDGTTDIATSKYPNASSGEVAAAYVAMENKHFYNATLVNLITPWTNEAQAVFPEDMDTQGILNDYTATVIGVIRDDEDFRKVLYDDILYVGNPALNLTNAYSLSNNLHYQELEDKGLNLGDTNVLTRILQSSKTAGVLGPDDTAGVITSRASAKAFFVDGTNRAMFRFTVLNHLCEDMEQLKDVTLPSDRIRQDVARSPGGDSRIFMNQCIGCHTGMDPMTQAFAYYDYDYPLDGNGDPEFEKGQLVFNQQGVMDTDRDGNPIAGATRVQAKNLINPDNFKPGFIVPDNSWDNFWREGRNSLLGWDASLPGKGSGVGAARSMAKELAHSERFASCQVEKVFKAVCLRPAGNTADRTAVTNITNNFVSNGHELKRVFAETAVYCKGL